MRTFCIACLALAVWIYVIYSYFNPENSPKTAAETPFPAGAFSVPSRGPAGTPTPPAHEGPLVIYCGNVVQVARGALIIRCVQNIPLVRGHHALETLWHGTEGQSEVGGEFLLSGDPQEQLYERNGRVLGVAELGPETTYKASNGWQRQVRQLIWVNSSTVANYHPSGIPLAKGITPPPASDFARQSIGLQGSALDKKP